MSFGYPVMAIANTSPNHTFSIPDPTSSNKAAGWLGSTLTQAEVYDASDRLGHDRGQRYTLAGSGNVTGTVLGSPARHGQLCANVATLFTVFALVKTSGIAGGGSGSVTFQIKFYSDSDVVLQTSTLKTLSLTGDNYSTWTIVQNTASITPPSGTTHFRLFISINRTSGTTQVVLDIRFLAVGTWTSSLGYYDWSTASVVTQPDIGVESYKTSSLQFDKDLIGGNSVIDRDLYTQPNVLNMPLSNVPNDVKIQLEYSFRMNRGRGAVESTTVNPGGGYWDIIIVPNQPTCLYIMLGRWDGNDFPLRVDRTLEYVPEPVIWAGQARFLEHI